MDKPTTTSPTDLTLPDTKGTALGIVATVVRAAPMLGGPVSNIINGYVTARKLSRVGEVLQGLAEDLADFRSEVSDQYVKSEDFEDLLEQTMRRVADERNQEKRAAYRAFLADAVQSPGESYDEQIRFLRTLEQLQPDHIRVMKALVLPPDPERSQGIIGSTIQTLRERLGDVSEDRIEDLIQQLNDLRITNITSLKTTMTALGAQQLSHFITPYGQRFMKFL